MTRKGQALSVLMVSTFAFTVCFMVWMMFAVIGIPIKKTLNLNSTQFGLLMATPVLTGSVIRVPLGIWTDKYGGRIVMALLMASGKPAGNCWVTRSITSSTELSYGDFWCMGDIEKVAYPAD